MIGLKTIKRLLPKLAILLLSFSLFVVPPTSSILSDIEISQDNTFGASTLDLGFTSDTSNFAPEDPLTPGDTTARNGTIQNLGALPFEYSQEYEYVSGDTSLCATLELQVKDELNNTVYSGALSGFYYAFPGTLNPGGEDDFSYEITLPGDADSSLREKSCTFNLLAKAWQVGGVFGIGFWDTERLQNTISTGAWLPPAPSLVYPTNGTIATTGSNWINNPFMDWSDVPWGEPVTYRYESSHFNTTNPDGSFTSPIYVSGALPNSMIPAPGTPDGIYYWHARACDSIGCGSWSEIWLLTVDKTIQEASTGDVVINEVMWMGSTSSTADEWLELRNTTGTPILLKNWIIENAGTGGSPNLTIPAGYTLPANGYFLIANYSASDVSSALAVEADWVSVGIEVSNPGEQLTLKDAVGNTIDQTPVTDGDWAAGIDTSLKQSMERNDTPGSGTNDTDWHTCIDSTCNDIVFWDIEGNNYGTPKAANLSSNDPTSIVESLEDTPVGEPSAMPAENTTDGTDPKEEQPENNSDETTMVSGEEVVEEEQNPEVQDSTQEDEIINTETSDTPKEQIDEEQESEQEPQSEPENNEPQETVDEPSLEPTNDEV